MSGWPAALRMARRAARRAKGRSTLVLALIGTPVFGLTVAAVSFDMASLTPAEQAERTLGTADARLIWIAPHPIQQEDMFGNIYSTSEIDPDDPDLGWERPPQDADAVLSILPAGSRVIPWQEDELKLETATGTGWLEVVTVDLADPLATGTATVIEGRVPAGPGEVALTAQATTRLGKGLGDQVDLPEYGTTYQVVGLLEFPGLSEAPQLPRPSSQTMLFHPDGWPGEAPYSVDWLVTTPEPVSWEQVHQLNQYGIAVYSRAVALDPPPELRSAYGRAETPGFAGGVLVAGLAMLQIILLAGPAFAIGARRRQRDLALIAAGGGTPAHLRRIVLADGVVLGGLAAVLGVGLGIAAALAARPLMETWLLDYRVGGYRVFPLALAAIALLAMLTAVLAALVPAFTAARVPVVQALAGRRGITRSRRRWLVLGLVLVGVGVLVTGWGSLEASEDIALVGLVQSQLGLALCTPALVGLVARLGSRLPLTPRIALRDTARNRAAAAPAIAAVMAAVAGGVGAGVVTVALDEVYGGRGYRYSPGTAIVQYEEYEVVGDTLVRRDGALPSLATVEQAVRSTLPVASMHREWYEYCPDETEPGGGGCFLPRVIVPPEQICPFWERPGGLSTTEQRQAGADPRCQGNFHPFGDLRIDDRDGLLVFFDSSATQLAEARRVLDQGGAVVTDARYLDGSGQVRLGELDWGGPDLLPAETIAIPGDLLAGVLRPGIDAPPAAFIGPVLAEELGLVAAPAELLFLPSRMPTQAEQDAFYAAINELGLGGRVEPGRESGASPFLLMLAGVAALIALAAATIATGLAAADRRLDLSTLAAVGASPRMRRTLSLSQSGVIAGLGTLLGLLAGLGMSTAVLVALNQRNAARWPAPDPFPITVPWPVLAALLAVPVVAMLGAGLLTRSRLPIERRL